MKGQVTMDGIEFKAMPGAWPRTELATHIHCTPS
jgi:hypothetical protein